jgi:hypothetical protein
MAALWDGPIFGRLGSLVIDGDSLQCHACGQWFKLLGAHVWRTHGLLAREYRRVFGYVRPQVWLASLYVSKSASKQQ